MNPFPNLQANVNPSNLVTLVTGASSGIGQATARKLASEGHRLVITARRLDALQQLATTLGSDVLVVQADMQQVGDIERLAQQAHARFGRVDVLVNNAGVGEGHPAYAASDAQINLIIGTNFVAPVQLARYVVPGMIERKRGHVINIGSVASHLAVPTSSLYAASKHALKGWNDALRRELRNTGVQVSLVCPGFIRTPMTTGVKVPMPGPEAVANVISRLIKRPRREVFVPGIYWWMTRLAQLSPPLTDFLLARINRSEV